MENTTLYVGTIVEIKDGRYYFALDTTKGMSLKEIRSILVGGVNLTIRSESTPEAQGRALKDVISFMEDELINVDSFDDICLKPEVKSDDIK